MSVSKANNPAEISRLEIKSNRKQAVLKLASLLLENPDTKSWLVTIIWLSNEYVSSY